MPPIIKDSDTAAATRETARSGSGAASSGDSAVRQQPVALEIPITVNGARTVEGSDKREPFSEPTKTVMVFGSGAVIRLSSSLAPGQLLFLTNERTKKEVVCQVVKSKNYRNVSGYVELEFTEPAVGFWGMRFPGDRVTPGPGLSPSASNGSPVAPRPVSEKVDQPMASSTPSIIAAKPATVVRNAETKPTLKGGAPAAPVAPVATTLSAETPLVEPWLKKREPASRIAAVKPSTASPKTSAESSEPEPSLPTAPTFELSRSTDRPASIFAPPTDASATLPPVDLSTLAPFFEVKPGPADVPAPIPEAPAAAAETEDLKEHTARLQEELSKMQFAEPSGSSATELKLQGEAPPVPVVEPAVPTLKTEPVHESAVRLVENASASDSTPVLAEPNEALREETPATISPLSSLEQEELKIPAWLAPLARNAAAPSSTQELVLREKAKRIADEPRAQEVSATPAMPVEKEQVAESRVPQFGSELPFQEAKSREKDVPRKSGKGLLFAAVAAGTVLLAGGGWWYMNQQSAGAIADAPAVQASSASTTPQDPKTNSPMGVAAESVIPTGGNTAASQTKPEAANSNSSVHSTANVSSVAPSRSSVTAARNPQAPLKSVKGETASDAAVSEPSQPTPAEVKKPELGEVHLKAPRVSQKRNVQNGAEGEAAIAFNEEPAEATADSLGTGLGIANSQPAAPVAVGGDVKQAKLISSVPPVYPQLARAQHASGNVTIDALIDASGRVTTMKVISGPTLLQQAAMEALRQWKYKPATLDGKPVPMHLSVTIQFRLQ